MKQRQAAAAQKKALQDLDAKAEEKRKSDKPSVREEAIKQRHANAAAQKQEQMKALEQKSSYIKDAYSAGAHWLENRAVASWFLTLQNNNNNKHNNKRGPGPDKFKRHGGMLLRRPLQFVCLRIFSVIDNQDYWITMSN